MGGPGGGGGRAGHDAYGPEGGPIGAIRGRTFAVEEVRVGLGGVELRVSRLGQLRQLPLGHGLIAGDDLADRHEDHEHANSNVEHCEHFGAVGRGVEITVADSAHCDDREIYRVYEGPILYRNIEDGANAEVEQEIEHRDHHLLPMVVLHPSRAIGAFDGHPSEPTLAQPERNCHAPPTALKALVPLARCSGSGLLPGTCI